jgi:hypothetical protein
MTCRSRCPPPLSDGSGAASVTEASCSHGCAIGLSKAPGARRTRLNFLDIPLSSFLMACAASSGRRCDLGDVRYDHDIALYRHILALARRHRPDPAAADGRIGQAAGRRGAWRRAVGPGHARRDTRGRVITIGAKLQSKALQSQSGGLAASLLDAIASGARDAGTKSPSPDWCAEPIQASSGFHLCIWPQAGQRNGTATQGRLLSRTHSVLSPVETGAPVRGH